MLWVEPFATIKFEHSRKDFNMSEEVTTEEGWDLNARAYGWEIGRGAHLSSVVQVTPGNPFMDPNWREAIEENSLLTVLIIQNNNSDWVPRAFLGREPDLIIQNVEESLREVEGLRCTKVYLTPDVLTTGINEDLFNTLYNGMIRSNVPASEMFQIVP